MSAIYGIINKNGKPVEREMVQKMKQAIKHRAKDGSGEWIDGNAAFGFCHLVVYPNQENERLPLESGDLVITANAHLHNRDELVNKLGVDPKQYATTPDSYLILKAFEKWGQDCVHHLDGEYVYAIWNKVSRELFISNDHIGFKALYYYDTAEQFIFCSEIKGIEAVNNKKTEFNIEYLKTYFFRENKYNETLNSQIKRLAGGARFRVELHGYLHCNIYWELQPIGQYKFIKDSDWYEHGLELLKNSVTKRLNTQTNVGVTLSGGLDSSVITILLADILAQKNMPLYAYSTANEKRNNFSHSFSKDSRLIDEVKDKCKNIYHSFVSAESKSMFSHIGESVKRDERIPNSFHFMDYALLQRAKLDNIGLLFSGFGGDFWFSTKKDFVVYRRLTELKFMEALRSMVAISKVENLPVHLVFRQEFLSHFELLQSFSSKERWPLQDLISTSAASHSSLTSKSMIGNMTKKLNSGQIASYNALFEIRNSYFGMNPATPLFDKDILEYLANVPTNLFLKDGYKRSFFRNCTFPILPKNIAFRLDKSPYVYDYWERISKEDIKKVMELATSQNELTRLLHIKRLVNLINRVALDQNIDRRSQKHFKHIAMFVLSFGFLKEKYKFDF